MISISSLREPHYEDTLSTDSSDDAANFSKMEQNSGEDSNLQSLQVYKIHTFFLFFFVKISQTKFSF